MGSEETRPRTGETKREREKTSRAGEEGEGRLLVGQSYSREEMCHDASCLQGDTPRGVLKNPRKTDSTLYLWDQEAFRVGDRVSKKLAS
jgi:hypothetical protein